MYELMKETQDELRTVTGYEDAVFHDAREDCFRIYGIFEPYGGGRYCRIPESVAEATNEGVKGRNLNTSGGRIRLTTDASYIALYCKGCRVYDSAILAPTNQLGFDLYIDDPEGTGNAASSVFVRTIRPPTGLKDGAFCGKFALPEGEHSVTINFPLYGGFDELYIGLPMGATLKPGLPYANEKPIVFYGSSITQGAAASRPGLAYTSIVCRRLNADYRNLGFAGSARAEEAIVDYLASIDMCCFVLDYDHNAPSLAHLRDTHYTVYKRVRDTHPDIPILMLSRPDFHTYSGKGVLRTNDSIRRRDIVIDTFRKARAEGDTRVFFIDGESFFAGPDECECTVDGVHPSDIGMLKMADTVHRTMVRILRRIPFLKGE
ncbi:MAG: hypothetical protein IKC26_01550 [Clostridia bacterium]|nr:hypothetical protein [Clostridia bacterium]